MVNGAKFGILSKSGLRINGNDTFRLKLIEPDRSSPLKAYVGPRNPKSLGPSALSSGWWLGEESTLERDPAAANLDFLPFAPSINYLLFRIDEH